uniref:Uncharacterized protein n=1 Tax=Anguilla anguilla TaxID=7936 RepID=A0A0E9SXE1_ANGAN
MVVHAQRNPNTRVSAVFPLNARTGKLIVPKSKSGCTCWQWHERA